MPSTFARAIIILVAPMLLTVVVAVSTVPMVGLGHLRVVTLNLLVPMGFCVLLGSLIASLFCVRGWHRGVLIVVWFVITVPLWLLSIWITSVSALMEM